MAEFDLINRYFNLGHTPECVKLDKGDDCALVVPNFTLKNSSLAITTDTLVSGTHFLPDILPHALAYRALATNLSDLAAMGANPKWFSLALCLPKEISQNENWMAEFSRGLFELANQHQFHLIGGDTTSGPLSITINAIGEVDHQTALKRSGAKPGDKICVSGTLGDAAGALALLLATAQPKTPAIEQALLSRFNYPTARVELGQALSGLANSAIDISDGLLADLTHILKASNCGAQIELEKLPCSAPLIEQFGVEQARTLAATGGDDYELCFTLEQTKLDLLQQHAQSLNLAVTCIGEITATPELTVTLNQQPIQFSQTGYQHFV
ncbi:thiamine-phosphate kinase [Catenovulum sp. 2E275]|uniref:thiamine-phosphate kinase n=1 Tax=Catenovulum sp. 2E275 TaxID=2980497 RepID=UPI0021CF4FE5|nr:thiamine-phosphate kinase [Catenovulum sp. 2E275]MCU4676170.1 thiamine-phosphate kinase [Catenovulum sp. 2E275]